MDHQREGVLVHGVGMTLKYRLESRDGPQLWWERALFWLCWACLAGLGLWIAWAALAAGRLDLPTAARLKLPTRTGERHAVIQP